MNGPAMLADHLSEHHDEIIVLWKSAVEQRGGVPAARGLTREEFEDHIPALLDRLAERLRGRASDPEPEARQHGWLRWRQGYDIGQMVNELGHLRTALRRASFEYASEKGFDLEQVGPMMEVVDTVIDEATSESVAQFQEGALGQTRQALEQAEVERARLATVLDHLPACVWVYDAEADLVAQSADAAEAQGFRIEEREGPRNISRNHGPHAHFFDQDGEPVPAQRAPAMRALQGEVVRGEELLWRNALGERAYLVSAVPVEDLFGRRTGAVVAALDVTDRKRLEDDLGRQRLLAEESSRHKTRLLTALSHDARTPLNAVVLSAELLESHAQDAADPEVRACVRTIRDSVGNVLDLLSDLLDLTRIDSGAMPVEASRFDLLPAVSECVSSIEGQSRAKGLDCRLEPEGFEGLVVETDRAKLKQVLSNLLANALRYTDKGGIRIWARRLDEGLEVLVTDTGIGIAPEDQERIFLEFAQASLPSGHLPTEGTGLGLAICRRLASLLRGEIRLHSEVGVGSTFSLFLPGGIVARTGPGPKLSAASVSPASGEAGPAGAVVVAEDHPDSRSALARTLRRMGYRVLEAENGREVLEAVKSERPLAILMDVNMPVMNGIEATEAIRSEPDLADLPVFALTGDVTVENQRRIGEAGVQGYIEKPVTQKALRQALGRLKPGSSAGGIT